MKKRRFTLLGKMLISAIVLLLYIASAQAQTSTPGGTVISNQARATYTDDVSDPTKYSSTSNTVTTTVSYVAGLSITPDQTTSSANTAAGTVDTYTFTLTNLGNFTDGVSFKASGASVVISGTASATLNAAFVDANGNGTFDAGDVNIADASADVYSLAQNGTVSVVVKINVPSGATAGQTILVSLGDTATGGSSYDNQSSNASSNEVGTSHPVGITPVNGDATNHNVEAKGTIFHTVSLSSAVANGPNGQPNATGPGPSTNTDYTNQAIPATAVTTPSVFSNTFQNNGNGADTFKIKIPTYPTSATVEVSIDGGTTWTTIVSNGTPVATPEVTTTSVAVSATFNYKVRVTLPSSATTYAGYDTIVRVCSVSDPTMMNDTIDRLYPGYLQLTKTATVSNSTGTGGATDPVPGATITYVVTYSNIASTPSGTGNVDLSALDVVITEDGDVSPNNWATYTTYVAGATDSRGGTIAVSASTGGVTQSKYVDTVGTVPAGQSGTLTFARTIR